MNLVKIFFLDHHAYIYIYTYITTVHIYTIYIYTRVCVFKCFTGLKNRPFAFVAEKMDERT